MYRAHHKIIASAILCLLISLMSFSPQWAFAKTKYLSGWAPNTGTVNIQNSGSGEPSLVWRFNYREDSCFLLRRADGEWKKMTRLSFKVKSDRAAPLFLRFDLDDGRIFILPFFCDTKWNRIDVDPDKLVPFGGATGRFNPEHLKSVFIVDLNGKDNGLTGERTVQLSDISFNSGSASGEKRLKIIAYDLQGRLMSTDDFRKQGLSADQWCFLTDSQGNSVPFSVRDENVRINEVSGKAPVIRFASGEGVRLEILFWQSDQDHKVWLSADNSGSGLEKTEGDTLFLNRELVLTRMKDLERFARLENQPRVNRELSGFMNQVKAASTKASVPSQAREYNRILGRLLAFSRQAVNSFSDQRIADLLTPSGNYKISGLNGSLKAGQQISVRLVDPEFRIGFGQSFGFVPFSKQPERVRKFYDILQKAGFNHADMPLFWDQVVDNRGRFTHWEDIFQFDYLVKNNFTLLAHGLIQTGMPDNVRKMHGRKFKEAAKHHLSQMVKRLSGLYGDKIILWEVVNEPSSNPWGNLNVSQRQELVLDLCKTLKTQLPGAVSMVNDYDWQRGEELSPALKGRITGTLQFYRGLMGEKYSPDVLGIEWYPGVRVKQPRFGVDMAEPCMDILDTYFYWKRLLTLGKPLFITESGFPGTMSSKDKNGYAWGRWDSRSQARAAVDTLSLAIAMDRVTGWVWWGVTDGEPWNVQGGLLDNSGASKPVLESIASKVSSLKTDYQVQVSEPGKLPLPAMPGRYCIDAGQKVEYLIDKNAKGQAIVISNSCDHFKTH